MTRTTRSDEDQLDLPGQTYVAEGPHDLSGMYTMHFALRRTLDDVVESVRAGEVEDQRRWTALADYWDRFARVLHHHHDIEDVTMFPVLLERAEAEGRSADRETLEAMEAEHEVIDPSVAVCTEGLRKMASEPSEDLRHAVDVRVTALRAALAQHLRHEETEALPMLQATMSAAEFEASEAYAAASFEPRDLLFVVGWVLHDLPATGRRRLLRHGGPVIRLLALVAVPWHARTHRRAFGGESNLSARPAPRSVPRPAP